MIANPIIHKEVLSSLRTKKAVILQGVFLLVLAGLTLLLWPAEGMQDIGGQQARRLLAVIAIGELLMVAMFAVSFTAATITTEKEKNTWECLFATAMKPWEIAFGKMAGSLSFLLLLVFSGIPALASLFLLGGVPGTEILAVVGLLFLTALYLGMIGLLVSTLMYRSYRSVIVAYIILLIVCFLAAAPAWPISGDLLARSGPGMQKILHIVASFSPVQAMMSLVLADSAYSTGAAGMPEYWQLFVPISCCVILLTGLAGLFKLSQPITPPRQREKLKVIERGEISARTFMFLIDPRKRKRMIQWWQNPVLIKEFRTRPMLQAQWLMRVGGICLIVSVVLMFLVSISIQQLVGESAGMIPTMAITVAALMVVLVLLIGPALTGGAISSDRESGLWDVLKTTRLSSLQIVSGKLQASVIPLLLLTLAMLPALFILLYFEPGLLWNIIQISYVVLMTIVFVSVAGMFFSSIFPRTATATAWTYATIVTIGLLTMLVLLGEEMFSRQFIGAVFVLNPVAAAMDAAGSPAMQKYGLVARHFKIIGALSAVMFLVTVVRVFSLRKAE